MTTSAVLIIFGASLVAVFGQGILPPHAVSRQANPGSNDGDCGPNEVPVQCKSCCPDATCENRNPGSCGACREVCSPGCNCRFGFVRRIPNGPCVAVGSC